MRIFQSSLFGRKLKKLNKNQKRTLDEALKEVMKNPQIGTEKKGDLKGIYIHKFKLREIQFLLAYRWTGEDLELITMGPHENYYRDLKSYLKSR